MIWQQLKLLVVVDAVVAPDAAAGIVAELFYSLPLHVARIHFHHHIQLLPNNEGRDALLLDHHHSYRAHHLSHVQYLVLALFVRHIPNKYLQ
jgi:hypothetical protein